MTVFDFVQHFILFIIPGLITYLLFCYLTGTKPRSDTLTIAIVFIFSTVSFLLGDLFLLIINMISNLDFWLADVSRILIGNTNQITVPNTISSIVASVVLGFISVLFWDKNLLFRLAQFLRITNKMDNNDVWDNLFDEQPWVIVRDYVSGNVYYGCVKRLSDDSTTRELLLSEVKVFSKNDGDYTMEQVYISRLPSEFSIEIDNYNKDNEKKEDEESD